MENTTLTTKRKINFFQIENELVDDGHLVQLKGSPFLVYIMLCRYTNNSTAIVFPSYSKIQEKTGLDRKTAMKAIATLEDLGYIIKIKKGGKDAGSNHYEIQELSTIVVGNKKKRNIEPPIAAKAKKAPVKERANIEDIEVAESIIDEAAETDAYKAYKFALGVWSSHTDAKLWSIETFTKKTAKHNQEALSVAYGILSRDTRNILVDTAKIYLVSPDTMVSQLYPRISTVISERKLKAANAEFEDFRGYVIVNGFEAGIINQEEREYYVANKENEKDTKVNEINKKLIEYYFNYGKQLAAKYGLVFDNGKFHSKRLAA